MKSIYLILLVIAFNAFGQNSSITSTSSLATQPGNTGVHVVKGNYAMDTANERQQYLGTWRYETPTVFFEIKIELLNQKLRQTPNNIHYYYKDIVTIKYKLIKDDVLLYDNLNTPNDQIDSYGVKYGGDSFLDCSFVDYTKFVRAKLEITKLNTVPEKIIFDLSRYSYALLNHTPGFYDDGPLFYVPTGPIEMVKVN
jgi:hypothetical protein